MAISPTDFGASFKGFLDQMSAVAPIEEPIFRRRLRDHFEREPNELPTLSEKFPAYDHANLNSALEAEFAGADCSIATFGVINPHPYMSATLSMLAAPGKAGLAGGDGLAEGPVEYANVTLDDDRVVACVQNGLFLLPQGLLERIERQTVRFSELSEKLVAAGRHLKRGILLHGPPGTGKTLTAMYVARAIRNRTVLLLTGRGQGLIEQSCALARALQPAIVILEDVDLVAEERTRPGAACAGPLLFELLNQMDGLADDADVLFLLTTNRPDILEPALAARPGRVDQAVEVPLPDAQCRRRLFELFSDKLTLGQVSWETFIQRTEGASAAFIRELMRKAALFAADEPSDSVEDRHLDEAIHELVVEGGVLTQSLLGFPSAKVAGHNVA
jgi:SpoVK/Ycf46/Vps4 family AAA+-type ATPase